MDTKNEQPAPEPYQPEPGAIRDEWSGNVRTIATTTLSESLRLAADLCDELQWNHGITWSGTNEIGLHADGDDYRRLLAAVPGGVEHVQTGSDYECDRYEAQSPSGLRVTVYGPHRALAEPEAKAPVVDLMAALKASVDQAKADRRKQADQ